MSSKKNTGRPGDSLREQAEKVVRQTMSPLTETATVDETKFMSHELRVHEIELEMQNQELRKNEEVLAKARQRYYDLYDLAPVGYFTLSSDRVILEANLTLSTMLGLHRGALVSQPLSRYIRSEDQDIYYHFFNRLLSPDGSQTCELRLVREGGTHFWAQLDANPAKGEDGSALIHAVVSDISARKRAELALQQISDRMELAAKSGGVGIWDYDIVNNSSVWDDQMCALYEINRMDFNGANEAWRKIIHPEDAARVEADYQMAIRGEKELDTEFRIILSDRTVRHIRSIAKVKRDGLGQPLQMIGTNWDISKQKQAEENLRHKAEIQKALREISEAALQSPSLDKLYEKVHLETGKLFPAKNFYIALLDESAGEIVRPYCVDEMYPVPRKRPVGNGLTEYVMKLGRAFYANQSELDRLREAGEVSLLEAPAHEYLGAPLQDNTGKRFGVIAAVWGSNEQPLLPVDTEVLATFAASVSLAIERKQAEEKLYASESRLREVLDNSLDASYKRNLKTNSYDYLSPIFAKISGYTPEEMETLPIETVLGLMHPDDLPDIERAIADSMTDYSGAEYHLEYRFKHKDGLYRWFHDQFIVLRDSENQPIARIGSVSDISHRLQAEEELRASEERFRAFVENANDVIYSLTPQGLLTYISVNGAEQIGFARDEIIGRFFSDFTHPDDIYACRAFMELILVTGEKQGGIEHRVRRENGEWCWYVSNGSPLFDSAGKVAAIMGIARDITERKLAERYRQLSTEILDILYKPIALPDAVDSIVTAIRRETEFDAVGIRVKKGDDFPYVAQGGFREEFLITENTVLVRDKAGGICRDETENPCLACICGLVLSGRTDPNNPLFTSGGSAWTNDSILLLDIPADQDPRLHLRNRCIHEGYSSIAWIPVRAGQEIIGLLQLNDQQQDRFTLTMIQLFEKICSDIGTALLRRQLEEELREREKRFRELVQDASVIILSTNEQGKITFVNEYGLSFFGYTAAELIGKTRQETLLPEQESSGRGPHKIFEATQGGSEREHRDTYENITKENRRVWVDWTYRVRTDEKTGEIELVGVGVDVTAAKRAEQELRYQFERRKKRDILNDSISRLTSQTEMLGLFRQLGWEMEPPYMLLIVGAPSEYSADKPSSKDMTDQQFHIDVMIDSLNSRKNNIVWQTPAGVTVLRTLSAARSQPVSANDAKLAADELIQAVSRHWKVKGITAGVAYETAATKNVADLYEQALAALTYGPVIAPGKTIYYWNDLGYFQFFVKDLQSAQVGQFVQDHLGPVLKEKREESRSADWATLEALISGDSLQVIADRLNVHKQTIAFRKKKLEEMLGVDLDRLETRTNLAVALKLQSLLS